MAVLLDQNLQPLLDENGLPLDDGVFVPIPGPTPPPKPAPAVEWSIDLLNQGKRIAMVESFEFGGIERYNDQGEWTLDTTPASVTEWQPTGEVLNGMPVIYGPQDVDAIRLVRGNEIAFPGLVMEISEGAGGFEVTREANRISWRWSGPDLWGILSERNAYPDPTTEPPWAVSHDLITGAGTTALASYLRRNLGVEALPDRQWAGVTVEDAIAGLTGEWSARMQTLRELTRRVATDSGIRCRPRMEFNGQIVFRLDAPLNLSSVFVFSDQSDLSEVHMRWVPATATSVIAGGQGEGAARAFARAATTATGARRRERFSEQTSLVGAGELARSAAATVTKGMATWVVDAQVSDQVASAYRYGTHFKVGDILGIEIDNVRYQVPIVAAKYEITPTRQIVRPILGQGVPDEFVGLLKDVANLASRLDRDVQ